MRTQYDVIDGWIRDRDTRSERPPGFDLYLRTLTAHGSIMRRAADEMKRGVLELERYGYDTEPWRTFEDHAWVALLAMHIGMGMHTDAPVEESAPSLVGRRMVAGYCENVPGGIYDAILELHGKTRPAPEDR